jgi:hypothetical protein
VRKRRGEEGRAFEYFGSLDRWMMSIRSFTVLVGSFPRCLVSALNCVLVDVPKILAATAHESGDSSAVTPSNSLVDTSQLLP